MSLYNGRYETASRQKLAEDESDQEEDALVEDYKEQVHFDDGMADLDRTASYGTGVGGPQDMQAQLTAAATPLEYQATLETKFASYDNYCNLFHYILNSDGPVDLEVPTVSPLGSLFLEHTTHNLLGTVLLGLGRHRRIYLPIRVFLQIPKSSSPDRPSKRRCRAPTRQSEHMGLLLRAQRPLFFDTT